MTLKCHTSWWCMRITFERCQKPKIYFSSFVVIELVDIHVIPLIFLELPNLLTFRVQYNSHGTSKHMLWLLGCKWVGRQQDWWPIEGSRFRQRVFSFSLNFRQVSFLHWLRPVTCSTTFRHVQHQWIVFMFYRFKVNVKMKCSYLYHFAHSLWSPGVGSNVVFNKYNNTDILASMLPVYRELLQTDRLRVWVYRYSHPPVFFWPSQKGISAQNLHWAHNYHLRTTIIHLKASNVRLWYKMLDLGLPTKLGETINVESHVQCPHQLMEKVN